MNKTVFQDMNETIASFFSAFYNSEMTTESHFTFLNDWQNSGLLLLGLTLLLLYIFLNVKAKKFVYRHLKCIALSIVVCGFILYFNGFNMLGSKDNLLVLTTRALIASLEMFASKSSLIGVAPTLLRHPLYMCCFALVHFLAICVSAIFILKLFGYRFSSWINCHLLIWKCHLPQKNREHPLFVFCGINLNAIRLAQSISEKFGHQATIAFVNLPDQNQEQINSSKFSFSALFQTANPNIGNQVNQIEELDALLFSADQPLTDAPLDEIHTYKDFFYSMGLKNLGRLIHHFSKNQKVDIYFLSDNEEENKSSILTLSQLFQNCRKKGQPIPATVHLYGQIHQTPFNEKILKWKTEGCHIDLIDPSSLSVIQLKKDVHHHPISYVDCDTRTGTVRSPFHALIIGFGETGREALKFLYEFSSFIGPDETEAERHFYIADRNLTPLQTDFLLNAPALSHRENLEWWNMSTHSATFIERLKTVIETLNYVVITVDNDEEAKDLMELIFNFAYRYRSSLRNFSIYVRLRDVHNAMQIRNFAPSTEDGTIPVHAFGTDDSIFNYDIISTDVLIQNFMFQKLEELTPDALWQYRRTCNVCAKKDIIEEAPLSQLTDFIRISYQEEQDRSNSWHIRTKMALAGIRDLNRPEDRLRLHAIAQGLGLPCQLASDEKVPLLTPEELEALMHQLDLTEHIRWMSQMELLGFVRGPKDMRHRQHPCMVNCKELQRDFSRTMVYDRCTVVLSFQMSLPDSASH